MKRIILVLFTIFALSLPSFAAEQLSPQQRPQWGCKRASLGQQNLTHESDIDHSTGFARGL
jgi:hypothetical protein